MPLEDDTVTSQMAGLSLYPSQTAKATQMTGKPTVRLTNIPRDTSLREAFLVFSLCLDEVVFVDVEQIGGEARVIVAQFANSNTARQVAQLLDGRAVFGSAFAPVKAELIDDKPQQTLLQHSRMLFTDPFHADEPGQPSQTQKPHNQQRPSLLKQHSSQQQQQVPPPRNGGSISVAAPQTQHAHTTASGSSSSSNSSQTLHTTPASGQSTPGSAPPTAIHTGHGSMLDQLTSPIMPTSAQGMLLLDDYELVRPWSASTTTASPLTPNTTTSNNSPLLGPTSTSKILPDNLTVNTGATDWDRRRFFMQQPTTPVSQQSIASSPRYNQFPPRSQSQSAAISQNRPVGLQQPPTPGSGSSAGPTGTPPNQSPTLAQQPQQSQQQQPQQQQQPRQPGTPTGPVNGTSTTNGDSTIPELSLLARIPPPTNPADQNPPCNTLYVGNLPPDATEVELRTLFQPQKGFCRLSFKNKQSSGNSHHGPMCFVEFEDVAHAARALAELYGRTLPRANGSTKGGIRLSFSKNPLGVRGPGQGRRGSAQYHTSNIEPGKVQPNGYYTGYNYNMHGKQ